MVLFHLTWIDSILLKANFLIKLIDFFNMELMDFFSLKFDSFSIISDTDLCNFGWEMAYKGSIQILSWSDSEADQILYSFDQRACWILCHRKLMGLVEKLVT